MAEKYLTQVTAQTDALADGDLFLITDVSDTSQKSDGTNKRLTFTQIKSGLDTAGYIKLTDISVTDSGGEGSLSYDNTTGVFTYTGPASSGGIALTDLSVGAEASASGDGALSYNSSTGVFTYTPPTLAGLNGSIDDLSDVTLTSTATNDILRWNGSAFVNTDAPTLDALQFDLTAAETAAVGQLAWNSEDLTLDLGLDTNVTLQIGQEQLARIKATTAIRNGMAVYVSGVTGGSDQLEGTPFSADSASGVDELRFLGIATETFSTNDIGFVTTFGKVRGVNGTTYASGGIRDNADTESWSVGDILYASANIAGTLTSVVPTAPDRQMPIAIVLKLPAETNITLFVRAEHGYHLNELHDVLISGTPADNEVLAYDSASGNWINQTAAEAGIITASSTDNLTNKTFSDHITVAEIAAPSTPSTGFGAIYAKTDGKLYFKNDAGTETELTGGSGNVTSVDMSVPTGFAISGNPITSSGTLALAFDTGYSLPTTSSQTNWNTAYGWGDHSTAGYLTDITGENLSSLSDVTITSIASGELIKWNGSAWVNNTLAEAGVAATGHTHATSDITSGTFADARIAESNVTQHQAALSITESQISDLGSYITASSTDTLTNKTFDANGTGNSLSNIEVADLASSAKTGSDTKVVTGTAGTSGDLAQWNVDGDLVDGPTPPTGTIVGTSDSQTLTNKTIDANSNTITNIGASEVESGIINDQTESTNPIATDTVLVYTGSNLRKVQLDNLPPIYKLGELQDVTLQDDTEDSDAVSDGSLNNGELLVYDASSNIWINDDTLIVDHQSQLLKAGDLIYDNLPSAGNAKLYFEEVTDTNGKHFTIETSGISASDTAGSTGGNLILSTGPSQSSYSGETTGSVQILTGGSSGSTSATTGSITIQTGDVASGATGNITLRTGTSSGTDVAGNIVFDLGQDGDGNTYSDAIPEFTKVFNFGTASNAWKGLYSNAAYFVETGLGSNYVAFTAPSSIASNITWTLPNADGSNGQFLSTNGSGTLSWATPLSNVVDDTTPQLGGQLDVNGNAIGDGTRELLGFVEDASAVNYIEIENEATGSGPIVRSTGTDTNVDLNLQTKGSGDINFESLIYSETNKKLFYPDITGAGTGTALTITSAGVDGDNTSGGNGGALYLGSGDAGDSTGGNTGNVTLESGLSTTGGSGSVAINSGGSDTGSGSITLQTGSVASSGSAGDIILAPASDAVGGTYGDVRPDGDGVQNLGTASNRWKGFYQTTNYFVETGAGTNYVAFTAPSSIASDVTWTLPNADGAAGQTLTTDGAGSLYWDDDSQGAGGGGIALTDLSVGAEASASGDGAISYDNTTGVFTYTPPTAAGISAITASSTDTLTNKTFDANGTGNSLSNVETADIASTAKTGADTKVVTGTEGTNGNLIQWNADGDAVDASLAVADVVTGSSTDTFTNKTFDANGTGNSLSNVETADIASGSKSGSDTTLVTGTAGTNGNLVSWNADGDAVDSSIVASNVALTDGDTYTGTHDFGGATLEIPNAAAPSLSVAGQIALDTSTTDHTALLKYHDGTNEFVIPAILSSGLSTTDNDVIAYNAANNRFEMEAQSGSGGGISNVVEDSTPQLGGQLDVNGNAIGDGTRELLTFTEDASAVNHVNIENEATGSGPIISAAGDDTNIDLNLSAKGTGDISLGTMVFDADQTIGAGQDNYVLTYDNATGKISLEAAGGGSGTVTSVDMSVPTGFAISGNPITSSGTLALAFDTGYSLPSDATQATWITASSTTTFTNKTFDANATGNSLSNVETADIASGSKTGSDTTLVTGTAGTNGNLVSWNADGDAVDSSVVAANVITTSNTASTSASGIVELATAAETTTGTDTGRAVTPDGLAGSDFGKTVVSILVSDPNGDAITTGDGKAYWRVPATLNGFNLVDVEMAVTTASTSGTPTVQIHNVTDTADMLSTSLTIDANETDSSTAATAAVINTATDDVTTADMLRIDIDTAGTGTKGLIVELTFQLP